MPQLLTRELWRIILAGILLFGLGFVWGYPVLFLCLGLIGYCAWHLYNVRRLLNWYDDPNGPVPDTDGLWAEVFSRVHRQHKLRNQREENLKQVIDRFKRATTVLPDAVVVLTPTGEIEAFNRTASRLLGLKSGDDVGQPIGNYLRLPEVVEIVNAGDPARVLEIQSPRDEDQWLSLQVIPYAHDERRLFIVRDITQLHRLDVMRQDFVANVSHELKTPLTVISGYLEALIERSDGSEFEQQALKASDSQARRMRSIVDDLLQLASMETTELVMDSAPVDVSTLAAEIRSVAEPLCLNKLDLSFEINADLYLRGNRRELYAAFNNLVVNAVRYTPPGGRVNVTWERTEHGAVFTVEDTGEGIPPENLSRLTERFYRVDNGRSRETGGTGLGLAIVKHVLLRHNAQLKVDSVVGEGTRMQCVFERDVVVDRTPTDRSHLHVVDDNSSEDDKAGQDGAGEKGTMQDTASS